MNENGPHEIDDPVREGRDDFATQPMVDQFVGKTRNRGSRKIGREFGSKYCWSGRSLATIWASRSELCVSEKDSQFRPRQSEPAWARRCQFVFVGKKFDGPFQLAAALQVADVARPSRIEIAAAPHLRDRKREVWS